MTMRSQLDRFARLPYGPAAALLVVAVASLGVVRWSHVTWRNSLSHTVAALDNVQQARLNLTRAYLAVTRVDEGDPTFGIDRAVAYLQDATLALDNWLAGRTDLLGLRSAPLEDEELRTLAHEYRALISQFQAQLRTIEDSAAVVDRRVAFATLERSADAIETRIHGTLRIVIGQQEQKHRVMLGTWVGFLTIVGVTVHIVSQSRTRTEERYRLLSTLAPVGIFRCDRLGTCTDVNEAWHGITGRRDRRARPWFDGVHSEDHDTVMTAWVRLVEQGVPFEDEFRLERPDGSIVWVLGLCRAEAEPGEEPRGFVGTFADVTDRKAVESQLRHAQKMEAVGQMTGGIAHDFRNILTIIMGMAETIERAVADGPPHVREDLAELQVAARRGADITKKLLTFSRMDHLATRAVDLCQVVRENLPMLRQLVPADVRIVPELPEGVVTAQADANAVTHILANLIANARDAMPQGGPVRIAVRRVRREASGGRTLDPGEWIMVSVRDAGSGMDERTRERIFDPFFTTKPPGAGTGLGMPMVLGLMKEQDGAIEVESAVGEGTTVHLYFRPAERAPRSSGPTTRPVVRGGQETILLVEDEDALRRVAQRALEKLGYRVLVAADGQEGLDLLRRHGTQISLVVADSVMPRLTGADLYAAIRRERLPVRFLFASGYAPTEIAQHGQLDADVPYLAKPWTLNDLAQKVRSVLDQGTS